MSALVIKASLSFNLNIRARKLKNEIYKRNYIYKIDQNEIKINRIKAHFIGHKEVINILVDYNDTLLNDLHSISIYNSDHYIHPSVKLHILNIIDKYVYEFRNDEKIIEFFTYIIKRYNCLSN